MSELTRLALAAAIGVWLPLTALGASLASPPQRSGGSGSLEERLTRNPDDRRPDEAVEIELLGRPLRLSGEVDQKLGYDLDRALAARPDDRLRFSQQLELELFYRLNERVSLFAEGKAAYTGDLFQESGARRTRGALARGESWLLVRDPGVRGLSVQLGRQKFRDDREWWWDRDLDALRLRLDRSGLEIDVALAQELAPVTTRQDRIDPESRRVLRVLGHASWSYAPRQRIEVFSLLQRDRSATPELGELLDENQSDLSDADLGWLGIRLSGKRPVGPLGRLEYWFDAAGVRGREVLLDLVDAPGGRTIVSSRLGRGVAGFALDAGLTLRTRLRGLPALTLGYARTLALGSSRSGRDRGFRQTGLHRNNDRFGGVDRFRLYGELLRPELSNLEISTVSLGRRLLHSSSIELVYHRYRQVEPSRRLRGSRLQLRPSGRHRGVGDELDLVIGLEEWHRIEIELVGALFRAGPAFGGRRGDLSGRLEWKLDWNF